MHALCEEHLWSKNVNISLTKGLSWRLRFCHVVLDPYLQSECRAEPGCTTGSGILCVPCPCRLSYPRYWTSRILHMFTWDLFNWWIKISNSDSPVTVLCSGNKPGKNGDHIIWNRVFFGFLSPANFAEELLSALSSLVVKSTDKNTCTRALWVISKQNFPPEVVAKMVPEILRTLECVRTREDIQSVVMEHESLNVIIRWTQTPSHVLSYPGINSFDWLWLI